jgi:hypothetical protein
VEHRVRINILSSAAVLALAVVASVVTSTAIASRAYQSRARESRKEGQTLTVRGSARQRITSDLAVWTVRLRAEGSDLPTAFATLEAAGHQVMGFLVEQGFTPERVAAAAITTETHHQRDERGHEIQRIEGYTLWRDYTVTTPDVRRVAAAAGAVTSLIKEGVAVVSLAPEFLFTGLPDLRVTILGEAAKDARARADELGRNAGFRVGSVRDVHAGILQVVRPDSTDVSGGGTYDTGTIEKDVNVVVTAVFGIEE